METVNVENKKEVKMMPKLRFPNFDGVWDEKKLGAIGSTNGGLTYSPADVVEQEGTLVLRSSNIQNETISFEDNVYVNCHITDKDMVKENDILLCVRNGSKRLIGKSLLIKKEHEGFAFGAFMAIYRSKSNALIYQFFKTDKFYKQVHEHLGATINQITGKSLNSFKMHLPSLPEQQKIASFLSAVDKKIQQLTRKKKLLEQYKKGVMQKIFSQEIRFKNENGKDYPEWKEKQLSKFLIPTVREVPTPLKPYLAIGIRSHCRGTFQKPDSDPNAIAMDKLFVVKENDLVVNITFAWEGAIAMVKKEDDGGLVSHRFPTYTFDRSKVLNEFFKYIFVQKRFRYILDLISPGGAGRNRVLSKQELQKIKWTMPQIQEQNKIASFLEIIDKKIEQATNSLTQTQQFKKGLLQQMFV